uniref:Neuromedin S n=1 Tax=Kryptolebias marmoratus TaxID=37003 RepID=A0A3Q3B0K0_KRYMA
MSLPTVRQLFVLCLFGVFGFLSTSDASLLDQWEDGRELRKVRGVQSEDLSDVLWRDQNEEQVQNIFKRVGSHLQFVKYFSLIADKSQLINVLLLPSFCFITPKHATQLELFNKSLTQFTL